MPGDNTTKLNLAWGQDKVTDATLSELVLDNFVNFYDWACLTRVVFTT